MSIQIRHLRLRSISTEGVFGADLEFRRCLNILSSSGKNTTGKSTCLQAIVYAMGLEKMLSPRREIPLPYAMRDEVRIDPNQKGFSVVESYVELEIANARNQTITVRRQVKGDIDTRLIRCWEGDKLTSGASGMPQKDFFVLDAGAATREAGFHAYLARFLGWELPEVQRYDGTMVPLYLECIFPMLFVEQKRGWSVIQGPFPSYLQIQDIGRRAVEFLMDLDVQRIRLKRRELQQALDEVTSRWKEEHDSMQRIVLAENARVQGIPREPTGEFALEGEVRLEILEGARWLSLPDALRHARTRLQELQEVETPRAGDEVAELEQDLQILRGRLEEAAGVRDVLYQELIRGRAEFNALERRLSALRSDLQKNRDALKLRNFGSTLGDAATTGICPTCHQEIAGELLPDPTTPAMGIEQNISFIESQNRLYEAMRAKIAQSVGELERKFEAYGTVVSQIRAQIRSAEATLLSPGDAPSEAAIRERLLLEATIETYSRLELFGAEAAERFTNVANDFLAARRQMADAPKANLSSSDKNKLDSVIKFIHEQLYSFGFKSYPATQVMISEDHFRPIVEVDTGAGMREVELGFEMSASDAIRLKWAYLLSFMRLGQERATNHPGLVVFDEPGQQEVEPESLAALMRWAAQHAKPNGQIILATSEAPEAWEESLEHQDVHIIQKDGYILQRLE